eukprot:6388500-Pyramimonas_sp.AAC.1
MALAEYTWHFGQRCTMHTLAAPRLQHPIVPRQGREHIHVPVGLLLRDGALLDNPGRRALVADVRVWCR